MQMGQGIGPWLCGGLLALSSVVAVFGQAPRVTVTPDEGAKRVDVTIDGKSFTSYIWPTTIKKPVLYPLRTPKGTLVTRGFPLDPRSA